MQVYSHPLFFIQGSSFSGPENPERLDKVYSLIKNGERAYKKGDENDADLIALIESTHNYLDDLRVGRGEIEVVDKEGETLVDYQSFRTACAAVATSIYAAQARGFALIRPPGHHAHGEFTHGFCLLNNMAIATKALIEDGERVLVLDLDVHHGCGTEEILQDEADASMISIYQQDIWPGKDHYTFAQNCTHIPLDGTVDDKRYLRTFKKRVLPQIEKFEPTVIGVSLGLDTFTDESFGWKLTPQTIREIRNMLKGKELFGILEGGYTSSAVRSGIQAFIED